MSSQLEGSREMMYRAVVEATAQGRISHPFQGAIASHYSGGTVNYVVDEALRIHGENGYMQRHSLEYLYRMVRAYRIGGGTDEIVRHMIASRLRKRSFRRLWSNRIPGPSCRSGLPLSYPE
jgi:alkylation response protein AidB-like acyl-CoA dehydrogenase